MVIIKARISDLLFHNIYLEILFTGVVGLLVTLLVISLNLPKEILLSLLFMGIFTHNLFDYSALAYYLV